MIRILASLLLLFAAIASAEDKVWSAVVLASNPARGVERKDPPAELAPYAAKLTKVFGYEEFQILGSATKVMDARHERGPIELHRILHQPRNLQTPRLAGQGRVDSQIEHLQIFHQMLTGRKTVL